MTKDYAKKNVQPRSSGSVRQHGQTKALLPSWIWLFMGVCLGVGLAIFIFWKWGQNYHYEPPQPPLVVSENESTFVEDSVNVPGEPESRFDFYTLLPNLKVEFPDVATPVQARKPEKSTETPLAYILQAGSFKSPDQADKLKATLALNGFETQVQIVEIPPNETWYRVYIGPFATKNEALVMQQNLKQNLVSNSLILKIRV